jgi:hypothetical protein
VTYMSVHTWVGGIHKCMDEGLGQAVDYFRRRTMGEYVGGRQTKEYL